MSTGRYSVSNSHWTRNETSKIHENLGETVALMKQNFKEKFNDNPHLCICQLCENLMQKPVLLTKCQHSFCCKCFIPTVEGRPLESTICPVCSTLVTPEFVTHSQTISHLLSNLKTDCEKCGEVFKHEEYCKENHLSMCIGQKSPLLSDVFKINKENDIPREFEKAALHVIKTKMAQSTLPNNGIEFMTGGSRVRTTLFQSNITY